MRIVSSIRTIFGRLQGSWIGRLGGPFCPWLWWIEARNRFNCVWVENDFALRELLCKRGLRQGEVVEGGVDWRRVLGDD